MADESLKIQEEIREGRDEKGRFVPGVSGNPAGKPKGSRHALEEDVVATFLAEFKKRGAEAATGLDNKTLWELAVKLVPKEQKVELTDTFSDLLRRADELVSQRSG
jgi:hypothetical protein